MHKTTRQSLSLFFCFWIILSASYAGTKKEGKQEPLKKLEEFHQRDGLPNFFEKLQHSREVRIAYFGGSITAAEDGWRDLTFDWFRLNFPQTAFYQIDAAIGGTGSNLGVFRVERDVLDFNPDLVFIEFAVNDGSKTREDILRAMEGIIRKCWKNNPNIDICFVYTATDKHVMKLVEGKFHTSVLAMEELANYYGIPSIHVGIEVARLFVRDKLILTGKPEDNKNKIVFTSDNVHPLAESGHPIYASVVAKYLSKMQNKKAVFKHDLSKPYRDDNWENAKMLGVSSLEKIGDWEKLLPENDFVSKFSKFMPELYKASPGAKLKFSFNGKYLALYDLIGPGTGMIKVSIDGEEQKIERFDGYCTYYRLGRKVLNDNLKEGTHEVEITVLDEKIDKEHMIREDRVNEYYAHPERFVETNWYGGYFLIIE